jgi:hypothetical protein
VCWCFGQAKKNEDEGKTKALFLYASIPHWWNIPSTGSYWWRKDFVGTTQSTHTNETCDDHQGLSLELWVLAGVVASASWPPAIMDC